MEPNASYSGSKQPATSAYPEPDECIQQTFIPFKRFRGKIGNKIRSRLNPGNAFYNPVQKFFSPLFLSKNTSIKMCRIIVLLHVLCGF
jgi:hypothetical protein